MKSNSASYILTHGNKILKNEKIRYQHFENQQIGFMLNVIDREYKKDELEKNWNIKINWHMQEKLKLKK